MLLPPVRSASQRWSRQIRASRSQEIGIGRIRYERWGKWPELPAIYCAGNGRPHWTATVRLTNGLTERGDQPGSEFLSHLVGERA
jgi:hypothetical protein